MLIISQIWLVQLIATVMFNLAALIEQQQAEPQCQTEVSVKQAGGVTCVLKKTKLSKNHSCTRLYANQGTFLSVCNHPNIVKYYRSYFLPDYSFHIEMEHLKGGSLCYANINGDYQKVYKWIYQTASALAYIHKLGIIHRDIKPANLVLDEDGNVKIIDFGVSMFKWCQGIQQKTIIGTPCYFAPETITSSVYNQKTDVFALGITSYQVTYSLFPFKGAVKQEYWRSILHDQVSFPQTCPKDLIRLIQKMLAKKPADRFSTQQILEELQLRQNREMKVQEMIDND